MRFTLENKTSKILVKKTNEYLEKQYTGREAELERFKCELQDVEKQIENIVTAITNGFFQQSFKDKMTELEEKKTKLEIQIKEIEVKSIDSQINEEQVRNLFSMFRKFVIERNLPECKKFIHNYVRRVEVFKDHVEVIFNVVFDFLQEIKDIKIKSEIKKRDLIKRYSNSFYIKISG